MKTAETVNDAHSEAVEKQSEVRSVIQRYETKLVFVSNFLNGREVWDLEKSDLETATGQAKEFVAWFLSQNEEELPDASFAVMMLWAGGKEGLEEFSTALQSFCDWSIHKVLAGGVT